MIETPLRVGAHQRGAAHARSNVRRSESSSPPLWEWAQAFPRCETQRPVRDTLLRARV